MIEEAAVREAVIEPMIEEPTVKVVSISEP